MLGNLDEGGLYEALLAGLNKAFSCVPHDFTVAKLDAHCF